MCVCVCRGRECCASILGPLSLFCRCTHFLVPFVGYSPSLPVYFSHSTAWFTTVVHIHKHTHTQWTLPLWSTFSCAPSSSLFFILCFSHSPIPSSSWFCSHLQSRRVNNWLTAVTACSPPIHTHTHTHTHRGQESALSADSQNTNAHTALPFTVAHTHTPRHPHWPDTTVNIYVLTATAYSPGRAGSKHA